VHGLYVLADISRTSEALLSACTVLLVAVLGACWRMGSALGRLVAHTDDHEGRIARIEAHEDAHDAWHMARGDR